MDFRIIRRIAKTELATLFYSPVAWILIVVLAAQIGSSFIDILNEIVKIKALGNTITFSATAGVVLGGRGIYEVIQDSIYLYIPLLTMNLMSREYASGSDKLLYSSPVSSVEIIAGKFLATLGCTAVLVGVLALPTVAVCMVVPNPDVTLMLACLASMFLLIMTYCSIGLFMSALTSYQVVAAVATLSALAVFNYIGTVGQESPIFREITYWLSIKGRASTMVGGLVCTDDIVYFLAVTGFFLALSVILLENRKARRTAFQKSLRYGAAAAVLMVIGFVSSRPALKAFWDATYVDDRTLSEESQKVMKQLPGGMTITTYVDVQDEEFSNYVPSQQMKDKEHFKEYIRFKPEIRMKYVYYYSPIMDTALLNKYPGMSDEQIAVELAAIKGYKHAKLVSAESLKPEIDLAEEGYQFVRVIRRKSGEEARLRLFNDMTHHPSEKEISSAMKKMINDPVKVATVTGHGERSVRRRSDRDFSLFATNGQFRNAMVNQGFDMEEVVLSEGVPEDINILFIPDPASVLSDEDLSAVDAFVERGGNLMILTDAGRQDVISGLLSRFGVKAGEDIELDGNVMGRATQAAADKFKGFYASMRRNPARTSVQMPGAMSMEIADTSTFKALPLLVSDSLSTAGPQTLALALTRKRGENEKEQRVIIVGDADCFSNSVLQLVSSDQSSRAYNFDMLPGSFRWLCYGEFPISPAHKPYIDSDVRLTPMQMPLVRALYNYVIPAVIALVGIVILYRRRKR
ncbi:MAG: Gldg family protein [Bacteroidales bacterium]|nr:Gldg family protein [Candidatus Cryptobacteroides caccocaballi]